MICPFIKKLPLSQLILINGNLYNKLNQTSIFPQLHPLTLDLLKDPLITAKPPLVGLINL